MLPHECVGNEARSSELPRWRVHHGLTAGTIGAKNGCNTLQLPLEPLRQCGQSRRWKSSHVKPKFAKSALFAGGVRAPTLKRLH